MADSQQYIEVTTIDDDRWDLIAWRVYGDPFLYEPIIVANPSVPIRPVLPGGLVLRVPLRAAPPVGGAPPWKAVSS